MAIILEIKSPLAYFSPLFADGLFCAPVTGPGVSFADIKHIKQFEKGVYLFEAGDVAGCIYRLIKGEARLLLSDESQEMRISRLMELNEVLGLSEVICGIPYKIGAKAITACTCEYVGREDLIRFLHDDPEAGSRLARLLGSNLQNSYKFISSQ